MKRKKQTTKPKHWANCFLEHAARETVWMREHGKQCDYQAAHEASIRRGVWLHAALLYWRKHRITTLDTDTSYLTLFICLVPCLPIIIELKRKVPPHGRHLNW